jgi:general stress protein YciG
MAELGRKGGQISGAKRMDNLSERRRKEIAKRGAAARWAKKGHR